MVSEKFKDKQRDLSQWLRGLDWEQTREKVSQESRARIVLLGLAGAGKSTLFNQLCGWTVSSPAAGSSAEAAPVGSGESAEDYGLFCLVDLPQTSGDYGGLSPLNGYPLSGGAGYAGWDDPYGWHGTPLGSSGVWPASTLDPLSLAEGADLLVYILDGAEGVRAADYRWVGRLRRSGVPLLVVLNKSDRLGTDLDDRRQEIEARLGASVTPVSALTGSGVADGLLPQLTRLCPNLTVALGRELRHFRHRAATKLIQQAALVNGLVSLEPVPLLDLPVHVVTLAGLMLRLAAIYDRPPGEAHRREMVAAVAGGLAGRYGAQQVIKLVPVVGWLVSSLLAWSYTWGLGQAAVAYFEAGGDAALDRGLSRARGNLKQLYLAVAERCPRPAWPRRAPTLDAETSQSDLPPGLPPAASNEP